MNRGDYGRTAEIISQITDPAQLQAMMRNQQYAGFTPVIIARLTEINRTRQAAQAQQPQAPTVAQQAMSGVPPQQQQGFARGGIIAFRHGGKVKRYAKGGEVEKDPYTIGDVFYEASIAPLAAGAKELYNKYMSRPWQETPERPEATPTAVVPPTAAPEIPQPEAGPTPLPPLAPLSDRDLGLPSLGGGYSFSTRTAGGRPGRPLSAYTEELDKYIGPNTAAAEERANLAENKRQALGNALMYAGLGMARSASERPHYGFLGNLAYGGTEGLTTYDKQEAERQRQLRDLGRLERQERTSKGLMAIQERGQDIRADQQAALARQGMGLQAAALREPALREQAIRRRALDLANADRKMGIAKDPSYYHLQATREYNALMPAVQAANVGAEQRSGASKAAYVAKAVASGANSARAAQDYDNYVAKHGAPPPDASGPVATIEW